MELWVLAVAAAAALLAVAGAAPGAAAARGGALPPEVLHHLLFVEPNLNLELLGNVSVVGQHGVAARTCRRRRSPLAHHPQVSDVEGGGLQRVFLRRGHRRAAQMLLRWMNEAGLEARVDAVGNVRGRAAAARPSPALLLGSHYDTVLDAGRFDGALGVVTALAVAKTVLAAAAVASGALAPERFAAAAAAARAAPAAEAHIDLRALLDHADAARALELPRPLEVVAFSDEEGVRFGSTFLGSRALAGGLVETGALAAKDAGGVSLARALQEAGMEGTPRAVAAAALARADVDAFVEVHMEQGPALAEAGLPLGVVAGIASQTWLRVRVLGEQGHAGTVPMRLRRDALAGAAEVAVGLEALCDGRAAAGGAPASPRAAAADATLVCTVGALDVHPNAPNVIPGGVNFTVDVRAQAPAAREAAVASLRALVDGACARRGLECAIDVRHEADGVACDAALIEELAAAAAASRPTLEALLASPARFTGAVAGGGGGAASAAPAPLLTSGAGHDAMAMAATTRVGMLFVRSTGGSHSPAEHVAPADVAAGAAALHEFVARWLARGGAGGKDEL
jgi:allantoate deiminase